MRSVLTVGPYRCPVRLGCKPEERAIPQSVDWTLTMRLSALPKGCESDALADTVCYAKVCEALLSASAAREYRLIESLALAAARAIDPLLPSGEFELTVHKLTPPIENLHGGSRFTLSFSK